jgi:hypothetical protein
MLKISHRLIRTVMLLYIMTLGVAMASSMVNPAAMNLICTSTGYKYIDQNGKLVDVEAGSEQAKDAKSGMHHLLDCSMCLAIGMTPELPKQDAFEPPHSLSYALRSIPSARLAALVAAPLPARGPPRLS